ncbi:MAG: hydrogen peroxide-inducible genes activator [Azoarcus sp.]|jgi:LysR family hydrogen peroxide-inducible transcriptional activator|nr:hydrogen peroxide-inducible genes activator [Azoarcus sp.]
MTLTYLRYLVALARERHFGRAAERCRVSQPTLSVAIKKLEEELGTQLFERAANDVRITEIGRRVLAQAEKVLIDVNHIHEIATTGKDPLVGPLRVGVIYTIGPYLLPHLIPMVHQHAPHMPLIIQESYTANLTDALKCADLDVIIISLPFAEPGIVTQPLYDEPFRALAPAQHSWVNQKEITPRMLADEQLLLLGAGNCFRDQVLEICPDYQSDNSLQHMLEGSSLETIRHMVSTGFGVTVLPSTAADELEANNPLIAVRPFAHPEPTRRVALAWRVTYPRSGVVDTLRMAILGCSLPGIYPIGPVPTCKKA